MAKKSKMTNYVIKGIAGACAFLASMMLICPVLIGTSSVAGVSSSTRTQNLFDIWEFGLDGASADYAIMTICFSIMFFLGLIMAVMFVLNMFVNSKLIDKILMVAGIVFAILAVVGLICAFVYGGSNSESAMGVKISISAGVGAILATIFSVATCAMSFAEKSLTK